jgi:DNA repair exonuclease SbcCD ATPase subunit
MAFQVSDFNDLIALLQAHPEWQSQLRNILLSDDFLALPNIVRQLGERMNQLAERVDSLGERIDQLTARMDERFAEMDRRFAEIDRRFELIDQRFAEIDRRFELIDQRFAEIDRRFELIERRLDSLESKVGDLQGWRLQDHYQKNGAVYFARLLKRSRILPKEVLADHLREVLDESEFKKAILIDVVVKGKLQTAQQTREVYLALEVSRTISPEDIVRAWERAQLISRAGTPTIPVVAGEVIQEQVLSLASGTKVVVHCQGEIHFWQEVLAQHPELN